MKEIKKELPGVKFDVPLLNYTTFRIGGRAKYFFEATSKEKLISGVLVAKKLKIPFYLLGGGSKLLISDRGFPGLIIRVQNSGLKEQDGGFLVEAGFFTKELIETAAKDGFQGLEWAAGIPGTVGGAVRGNAGAWGKAMKDVVRKVEAFDIEKEKRVFFNNDECKFDYRTSIFKENPNLIILSCEVQLERGNKEEIEGKMKDYLDYRKKHHPLEFPSAGSIFKNPNHDKEVDEGVPLGVSAWKFIAGCGLAGKRIGDVKISEKHSNFIINLDHGKAEDVEKLIKLVKEKVREKFDITLEEEIQYLPPR